jgi:hypothetical protein
MARRAGVFFTEYGVVSNVARWPKLRPHIPRRLQNISQCLGKELTIEYIAIKNKDWNNKSPYYFIYYYYYLFAITYTEPQFASSKSNV